MSSVARVSILDTIGDEKLFAPWFSGRGDWSAWFAFLAALFALPMSERQLAIYQRCTGRDAAPTAQAAEAWLVCGPRSGKSFVLALVAVYLACFKDYRPFLAPGERAMILIIATDRRQARVILGYIRGFLTLVPMLARLVESEGAERFELSNSVTIEVATASFRTVRGYTMAAALLDELAFWPTDNAAEPDTEIIAALRPGMATIPGAMLLCASSPYARRGALWEAWRKGYGKESASALVWQAATRVMNPSVPQSLLDAAKEADPANAAAEYEAQFRSDIEAFVSREVVEACIEHGRYENPPSRRQRFNAFVDPSGGSRDSMTMAIAHRDGSDNVLDLLRERRSPFNPSDVVAEFAQVLKSYGVTSVTGDRYAGEWPRESFREHGINYIPSTKPKSEIYRDFLPLLNSQRVRLLENERLVTQLVGLERRTSRGGRDVIDHAPGAHDDLANAAAGALSIMSDSASEYTHALLHNVVDRHDRHSERWTQGDILFQLTGRTG